MTTVLTLEPLGGPLLGGTMRGNLSGQIVKGKTVIDVKYPASMAKDSIDRGVTALNNTLAATPGQIIVFAHSQGAQVVSRWLRTHAANGPDPQRVSFILIGNPLRRYGGYGVGRPEFGGQIGLPTPNDTAYPVQDVSLQYDGWSDSPTKPSMWADMNAKQDRFGINGARAIHAMGYRKARLDDPKRRTYQENTTTYILIPHRPLLPFPQSWIEKGYARPEDRRR